jgi:hypothetical protein
VILHLVNPSGSVIGTVVKESGRYILHVLSASAVMDMADLIGYLRQHHPDITFKPRHKGQLHPWMERVAFYHKVDFGKYESMPLLCLDCEWHRQNQRLLEVAFVMPNGAPLWSHRGMFTDKHMARIDSLAQKHLLVGCDLVGDFSILRANAGWLKTRFTTPALDINIQLLDSILHPDAPGTHFQHGRSLEALMEKYTIHREGPLHHASMDAAMIAMIFSRQEAMFQDRAAMFKQYWRAARDVTLDPLPRLS